MDRELAFANELADLAASTTTAAFGGRVATSSKRDGTPVTEIDVATEDALRAAVEAAFPGDAIVGEERGRSGPTDAARVWTLDPIDGTKHFADGVPLWATLIGLAIDGDPVAGLVDVPVLGERYVAAVTGGATRNGSPIRVSDTADLADAVIGHSALEEWFGGGRGDALVRVATAARRTRGLSDAWGQMLVASGAIDACLEHEPCGVWDWTPTAVIVSEAGGLVTSIDGGPLAPGCDLLTSNGRLHDAVRSSLAGPAALPPDRAAV
jgi:histidinol-phosphatase